MSTIARSPLGNFMIPRDSPVPPSYGLWPLLHPRRRDVPLQPLQSLHHTIRIQLRARTRRVGMLVGEERFYFLLTESVVFRGDDLIEVDETHGLLRRHLG